VESGSIDVQVAGALVVTMAVRATTAGVGVRNLGLVMRVVLIVVRVTVFMAVFVVMTVAMTVVMVMIVIVIVVVEALTQVEVSLARVENFDLDTVEEQAEDRNDEHEVSLDDWRCEETSCCFLEEPDCHDPDGSHRDESSHELCSVPAER